MLRRGVLATLVAAALTIGIVGVAVPSGALTLQKNGSGSLTCKAKGSVKFAPALTTGGEASTKIKVSVKMSGCTGSGDGATVTGGHVSGTLTGTPSGNCAVTAIETSGTLTATFKVKAGSPSLNASTLSFNAVQATGGPSPEGANIQGAPTAGSFVGDGSYLSITIERSSPCGSKWPVGGSAGPASFELG